MCRLFRPSNGGRWIHMVFLSDWGEQQLILTSLCSSSLGQRWNAHRESRVIADVLVLMPLFFSTKCLKYVSFSVAFAATRSLVVLSLRATRLARSKTTQWRVLSLHIAERILCPRAHFFLIRCSHRVVKHLFKSEFSSLTRQVRDCTCSFCDRT